MIKETLTKSQPLLSDFSLGEDDNTAEPLAKDVSIPYPFQIQVEGMKGK